ncbi:hypothetical protein CF165_23725 [Amycolatopsis vastitatis]|uniref:Uncharacterized protein n=1 Tax=Amycolatopsis vastitatis TaxID=1905142 RepID=A0A229T3K0_9PSEU|nr:hypothetical protein CF165_23725 [Amycolatopsis vastitatis]
MSPAPKKTSKNGKERRERRLRVRSVRRDTPDMRKLSKAIIGLALAEAEREAQAQAAEAQPTSDSPPSAKKGGRHGA